MSLLNPATAYRRSTNRPRVPVVLPLVRVVVDEQGRLTVTVDDAPLPDADSGDEPTLSRGELRQLLDQIASERDSALRVEIHEPDGKVFTDFHSPEPTADNRSPASPVAPPARAGGVSPRRTTLSAKIGTGEVTGSGFAEDEEVSVAVVIYRHRAGTDGTIEMNLPVPLLERHSGDVVLVGATSGSVTVTAAEVREPIREAS